MSGFGTKKPGGDRAVQLTFPSVFQDEYSANRLPLRFYPTPEHHTTLWVGDNEPAQIHAKWANEAHNMVRNGVYATRIARQRAFQSHNGYYGMPKPVLSQRKLGFQTGALQSGNIGSALGNDTMGGYAGGVLRTKAGQDYAQKLLRMRAEQLSKLEGVVLPPREMSEISSMGAETEKEQLTESTRVELQGLMDSLLATFSTGTAFEAKTTEQFLRFTQLLLRFAVYATASELDVIRSNIADMGNALGMYDTSSAGDTTTLTESQLLNAPKGKYFFQSVNRLLKYVNDMLASVNASTKDRKVKSQSLVRSLGLSALQRIALTQREQDELDKRYLAGVWKGLRNDGQIRDDTRGAYDEVAGRFANTRGYEPFLDEEDEVDRPLIGLRDARRRLQQYRRGERTSLRASTQEQGDRAEALAEQRVGRRARGREAEERQREGQTSGDGREMFSEDTRTNYGANASGRLFAYANDDDAYQQQPGAEIGEALRPPPMARSVALEDVARGTRGETQQRFRRERLVRGLTRGLDIDFDRLTQMPLATRETFFKNAVADGRMERNDDNILYVFEILDGNASATGRVFGTNARAINAVIDRMG